MEVGVEWGPRIRGSRLLQFRASAVCLGGGRLLCVGGWLTGVPTPMHAR